MVDIKLTIFMTELTPSAEIGCETWLIITKKGIHGPKLLLDLRIFLIL